MVEVLASHGDTHLGGDDFDQLLLDHVCDEFAKEHKIDLRKSLVAKSRVLGAVEEAKKLLSAEAVATIQEEFIAEKGGAAVHLDLEIERAEYEALIEPLLAKTLTCVDQSLDDARLNAQQIDKVILVGGASRTPLVHRLLEQRAGAGTAHRGRSRPVRGHGRGRPGRPDQRHRRGAGPGGHHAAHAGHLGAGRSARHDRSEHCFVPIIHRNTPLPATRSEMFTTAYDQQEAVMVSIYQGENEDVRHNQFIGEFLLEGLCEVDAGNEILVRFGLDLNGILKVTAEEHATGLQKQMTVENAVSRFRRQSRPGGAGPALQKLVQAVALPETGGSVPGGGDSAAGGGADVPADVAAAIANSSALVSKALGVAAKASEQDRQEIDRLVKDLMEASAARSVPRLKQVGAELEDLVFYLQDA